MGEKRHRKFKEIEEYQGLKVEKAERDIRGLRRLRIREKIGCW